MKLAIDAIAVLADIFTVAASGVALYVFYANRGRLSQAIDILLSYSLQTTLAELREKLERLNEYNANEPTEHQEIRNILHELAGQIRGNRRLAQELPQLAKKVEQLAVGKKLTEPAKRSIVSEVREELRNIHVNSMSNGVES